MKPLVWLSLCMVRVGVGNVLVGKPQDASFAWFGGIRFQRMALFPPQLGAVAAEELDWFVWKYHPCIFHLSAVINYWQDAGDFCALTLVLHTHTVKSRVFHSTAFW